MKIFFERMKRNDKMNVMMYREKNEMDVTVNDLNEKELKGGSANDNRGSYGNDAERSFYHS